MTTQISPASLGRRPYLVEHLERLQAIEQLATVDKSYGAAVNARKQMLQIRDKLDQLDAEHAAEQGVSTDPDARDRELLIALRRARAGAEACSSWVAVSNLSTKEAELNAEQRRRDEARRTEELAGSSEDEKVRALVSLIGPLPDSMRAKIKAALAEL